MKIITDGRCTEYGTPGHPERPQRISRTVEKLQTQHDLPLVWDQPLAPGDDALLRAHTREHIKSLSQPRDFDADTPAHPHIEDHARRSAGGALQALKSARRGELAFSLMRPPGHHATPDRAMGFCYLNSMAIATLEARANGAGKVAVFDFDVHHGNGTEDILFNKPGCAFFSVHQFPAYPGSGREHRGENCFNYPVPPDSPAEKYRVACTAALAELRKFKPDIVAVSAGFDSYKHDPLCQQQMDIADFHWLGQSVRELGIPVFSALEGGYSNKLPDLIFAYLLGLNGMDLVPG